MGVRYVDDFSFAPSPPRPTIKGYARGGHVTTPQPFKNGGRAGRDFGKGQTTPEPTKGVASKSAKGVPTQTPKYGKLSDTRSPAATRVEKRAAGGHISAKFAYASGGSVNPKDAKSTGSFVRSPPKTGNMLAAANSKFAAKVAKPATKEVGPVQRMAAWSDFNKGGSTKPAFDRLKNLGHYAHGGKVSATKGEKPSGKAAGIKVGREIKSGVVKKANGGLTRGVSARKNAAIHVKAHRPKMGAKMGAMGAGMGAAPLMPGGGATGALAGLSGGQGPMSAPPPGLPMGGAPGGPPAMKRGGRA